MVMNKKDRKYYRNYDGKSASTDKKIFLVRYCEDYKNIINEAGPFNKEEEAIATLSDYLRKGICSWLVTYNG